MFARRDDLFMPTITSGNTASPTVMIAEKGAAAVIEDRRVGRLPEVAIAPGPDVERPAPTGA